MKLHVAAVVFLFLATAKVLSAQDILMGYRLENDPTYMIVAPRKVFPNMIVQVQVSILKLYHSHIVVHASIRKDGEEFAALTEKFDAKSTKVLQMKMLPNARPGNYTLRVEGTLSEGISGNIFVNESALIFDEKQVSVFIQTNKPLYRQGQTVLFRIVPVTPNLMMVHGSMDIYAQDPTGTVVRRWLSLQANAGILENALQLSDQPTYGTWNLTVKAFGYYYYKTFQVEEFWMPRFYVNVSMPAFIMEDTFGIAGVITANHTSGRPTRGSGLMRLEIRPPLSEINQDHRNEWPYIERKITYFTGRTDFMFTMKEIAEALGRKPGDHELHLTAEIYDWFLQLNETGYSSCVIHERVIKMVLLGDKSRTFKPGFPQTVYWALVEADGFPLYGNRRQVTINRVSTTRSGYTHSTPESKLIVRDDGIVEYNFVAEDEAKQISIRAYFDNVGRTTSHELVMYRVYSFFDHYIHIETSTEQPTVNEYMVFTVRSNTWVDKIYYLIVSKGNIIVGNALEMNALQKTFSIALSRDMVPSARIVAYCISNGEVVADGLNFFVNGSMLNEVKVRVNMGKDFSKDTVEISGFTDPGSFIAFSGNDFELYANGGNSFITENEVIEEQESYDSHANGSFSHTWYLGEEYYRKVYFPAPTYGVDANTTFSFAGLLVFTDANLTRIIHYCNETRGLYPCNDGTCYRLDQWCDGVVTCPDGVDEMGCLKKEVERFTPRFQRFKHVTRHFEEDTKWVWTSHYTKPDGRIDLKVKVPKEPMTWAMSAFAVSREKGLGIVPDPARYESTRPFYIEVEMPTHAVKGEQIGVRVALFNYWTVDMECIVMLHDSPFYHFVMVSDFGVVSSYSPKTQRGDVQTMVYVQASRMATIYLPVLPLVKGTINVTVSATSFMGRDVVTRNLTIVLDGVTNYYNTPYLIDLVSQGSIIIPDFDIPVPERFWLPEQREHLYVPGSAKAFVSIVGDVVGPGFFKPYLDAENLIRKPYGCAEQNTFNFAANLYYLKFLKITNQLRTKVQNDALNYMNLVLQRTMSYMNGTDGSFSMFRDYRKPTPSVWLTAYILQVLNQADEADWHDILYIPVQGLRNRIGKWLTKQQNPDGSFSDTAPIYDRKMNGTYMVDPETGEEVYANISLTAHVLIGLAESTGLTGTAGTDIDSAKQGAVTYLERFVPQLKDPYQTALVTYALTVGNSNERNDAFRKLDAMKRTGEFTYWSREVIPPNPFEIINTVPYQKPRIIYPDEGSAVEATAYALLVYLQNNRLQEATSIMKWLQTMRNSIGGYGGTRDTIVALQALTAFGRRDTNRDLYNMEVKLEVTSVPQRFKRIIKLNRENWADLQEIPLPKDKIYGQVKAQAKGTGIALIQLHTEVNVEYPWLIAPKPIGRWYNLTIDRLTFHGRNFSVMDMTACAMWVRPDVSERTGMTVMEIDLPTGYVVMNDRLRTYVQSGIVPTLSRAEFYNKKIVFYIDYVEANRKTCVSFRADRWYPVANATIQHTIKVYDYYEPGMHNTTLYTTYNLFNLHICQVCASFQCPYCPFYNAAPITPQLSQLAIILALLAFIMMSLKIGT